MSSHVSRCVACRSNSSVRPHLSKASSHHTPKGIAAVQLHRRGAASLQKGHFQVLPILRRVPLPTGPEGYLL